MDDFSRVRIINGSPVFKTGIPNRDFAQAKLLQYLPECGFTAIPAREGKTFSFSPWRFTGTAEDEDGSVTLLGEPFEGAVIDDIFLPNANRAEREKNWRLLQSIAAAYADAYRQGITLPAAGPHTILLAQNGTILFLPAELCIRSLQSRSDAVYSTLCGCYINLQLPPEEGAAFLCAVMAYRFLTGELPYPQTDSEKRNTDYFDGNFLPLASYLEKNSLTDVIDNLLDKKNAKKRKPCLADLQKVMSENLPFLPEDKIFTTKKIAEMRKKEKKITRRRFIRKNQTILTAAVVCLLLSVWGTISFIKNQALKETTAGLTSFETVEMFYSAYNRLDVEAMSSCLARGAGKDFVNFATNVFVTTKVRQAYEGLRETLTPDQYFLLEEDKRAGRTVFGVFNFTADGKYANQNAFFDSGRDKKKQTGINGERTACETSYYFFMSQAEDFPLVLKRTDKLVLEYKKNRWLITEIISESKTVDFKTLKLPRNIP